MLKNFCQKPSQRHCFIKRRFRRSPLQNTSWWWKNQVNQHNLKIRIKENLKRNLYRKYTVLVYPNKKCDVHLSGLTRTSISQWIIKQERTGSQGTFCKRELKQFQKIQPHHPAPQPIDGDDHRQTSPSSDKSSTKTRKRSTDFTKRLTKIENSLQRLDTSLFEFRFKLDHIQSLASKSNQSHI